MTSAEIVTEKKKRFRSPAYPIFDLGTAVDRASKLLKDAHHHPVGASVLSTAWGMKSADGRVWRHAAALIQYGLAADFGTGKSRKFQITDIARRIVKDENPDSPKRVAALKTAMFSPVIHQELWDKFKTAEGLSDAVIKTYLTVDRAENGESAYSGSAADEVIETYRASLAYAGITESDTLADDDEVKCGGSEETSSHSVTPKIKIGDHVKWTSGGVDQFKGRKVEWVSDDGSMLRVFGSPTGIPMNEVEIVTAPAPPPMAPAAPKLAAAGGGKMLPDIAVYQVGGRLQITADVDAEGIEKLENMLAKYKEILKILNTDISEIPALFEDDDGE